MRQHDSGKDYNEKFDISSANTWERKIITMTGNTGDTFADDNGIGLWFRIMLEQVPTLLECKYLDNLGGLLMMIKHLLVNKQLGEQILVMIFI